MRGHQGNIARFNQSFVDISVKNQSLVCFYNCFECNLTFFCFFCLWLKRNVQKEAACVRLLRCLTRFVFTSFPKINIRNCFYLFFCFQQSQWIIWTNRRFKMFSSLFRWKYQRSVTKLFIILFSKSNFFYSRQAIADTLELTGRAAAPGALLGVGVLDRTNYKVCF